MSGISTPRYPGSRSHGTAYKPCTVIKTDHDKLVCIVRDNIGKFMEVRCDIMRAKGNLPEPGEVWYIDRQYDIWVFGAILNGGTRGVEVANVTDLPETLDLIHSNTLGQITAKGDILAATAGETVTRQPVGTLNQSLVADPAAATGLAYKDLTGRPAAFSGLPGATATGRYVGNTVSGAPTTGTFAVGDWVTAQNGIRWTCSVAGTPGTWITGTVDGARGVLARSRLAASTAKVGNQSLSAGAGTCRVYAPVKAGRLYRIGSPQVAIQTDIDNAIAAVGLRCSTDGSNTNIGSTGFLYQQSQVFLPSKSNVANGNRPGVIPLQTFFAPTVDCVLSGSIVITSTVTSGGIYPDIYIYASDSAPVDTFIEDVGADPGL
jgi:hypothetical protein